MKITRNRYQQGSIRKVPRAKGFAWEYRYYVTSGGKRKLKMQAVGARSPVAMIQNPQTPLWNTLRSPSGPSEGGCCARAYR